MNFILNFMIIFSIMIFYKFYSEYKNSFDDKININSYYKFIFNENIPKEEKKEIKEKEINVEEELENKKEKEFN